MDTATDMAMDTVMVITTRISQSTKNTINITMKTIKSIITIYLLSIALSISAQLNGDGFYRICNKATGRYITVIDNDPRNNQRNSQGVWTFKSIGMEAGDVSSSPASIMSIHNIGGNEYTIESQGVDTETVTGYKIKIETTNDGYYRAYGEEGSSSVYLGDGDGTGKYIVAGDGSKQKASNQWIIQPVNSNAPLKVSAPINANGRYYTFYYVSFAYRLSSGMKAYYISNADETSVTLTEVQGIVPKNTPVILECTSPTANAITPLTTSPAALPISGEYYSSDGSFLPNKKKYYSSYRLLSKDSSGNLVLEDKGEGFFPANTGGVFFDTDNDPLTRINITIPSTTKIAKTDSSDEKCSATYSITGQRVNNLQGIIIYNGKKYVKK